MKTLLAIFLTVSFSAFANIEYDPARDVKASDQEISNSRACFKELSQNGCADPGENLPAFRSCMHDVFPKLSDSCQRMMSNLYKRRD